MAAAASTANVALATANAAAATINNNNNNMESMSSSIEPVVPRTANLLACKQWWRVCFLYGDQQKYYRQVYSKAAAQRLALSQSSGNKGPTAAAATNDFNNENDNNNKWQQIAAGADYDTVAIDFIETQLDEQDNNEEDEAVQDVTADNDATTNKTTTKINNTKTKELQQQQPLALFPSKCNASRAIAGNGTQQNTNDFSSTLRKSKRLLRSLRGHRKGGGDTNENSKKSAQGTTTSACSNTNNATTATAIKDTLDSLKLLGLTQNSKAAANSIFGSNTKAKQNSISTEATKQNAKHTVLDDPFLFGIDEDHLGDLLIRGQQQQQSYSPSAILENISQHFNDDCNSQLAESLTLNDLTADAPRPALPPKRIVHPLITPPPHLTQCPTNDFKLNDKDLEFLNLSLRNRSLPRDMKPFKDPHDISFTFKEDEMEIVDAPLCHREQNVDHSETDNE